MSSTELRLSKDLHSNPRINGSLFSQKEGFIDYGTVIGYRIRRNMDWKDYRILRNGKITDGLFM